MEMTVTRKNDVVDMASMLLLPLIDERDDDPHDVKIRKTNGFVGS